MDRGLNKINQILKKRERERERERERGGGREGERKKNKKEEIKERATRSYKGKQIKLLI